jgi:DMSO/TMAO reductase YedYZ molybdopterin-dependent catalytic subunit
MMEIANAVGGITEAESVKVEAKDGYTMTFSYAQAANGEFTTLDAATGKEVPRDKPIALVAYEYDGKAIADDFGPLRVAVISGQDKVTEGHWWVKWVTKITIASTQQPWSLKLEGKLTEDVVSTTFESCAAPGCHGASWKDDTNREWQGVPLWLLAGRVDDDNQHKTGAFNDELATKGYTVVVTATDGFSQKFASADVKDNNSMIVAYQRDGGPVPENQWPLRLVGANLSKQQMVGKVATIRLDFSAPAPTTKPPTTTAAAGPAVLTVTKGTQTKTFTMAELKALPVLSGYGATKNKSGTIAGPFQYKGVALTDLLAAAGGMSAANSVKITAKDGFSKTLTYAQVTEGGFITFDKAGAEVAAEMKPVLFVAYERDGAALDESTGPLQFGLITSQNQLTENSWWVKQTEKIEIVTTQ